ncbi:S-adenosyl-L-methionine-dependent methyltransferase [Coniochaeta sp. PMI_546]|nr:S-adenosyl-L-methionine-dependent methyltransferase [Coniochaeta sp. PMI_546]
MENSSIIEPLPDDDDDASQNTMTAATSDYDPSIAASSFCSVSSSVNGHVWEYGRRYQIFRYGRYPMPNDEEEFKRESLKHAMFKEVLHGQLFLAPVGPNAQKIIDLGTGFGEWAIEVGDAMPSAKVTGIDLSPIQPVWLPPNVEFIVDDIEDEWTDGSDYDYVHSRVVFACLKDPPKVIDTAFRNLKAGGWIEFCEFLPVIGCDDGTVRPDNPLLRFYDIMRQAFLRQYGMDLTYIEKVPSKLEQTGFINIQRKIYHLPIGDWPREKHLRTIGVYMREIIDEMLAAMAAKPFTDAGIDKAEVNELLHGVRAVLRNKRIHPFLPAHIVWAQKPPSA